MTPEQQIKALAELDGLHSFRICSRYNGIQDNDVLCGEKDGIIYQIENYLESYNAIIPLIQKQSTGIRLQVFVRLQESTNSAALFLSTTTQLCEALLRSVGKWKD